MKGSFEVAEGSYAPAMQRAKERKQPCPMVRVGLVKDRQTLLMGESDFAKGAYQLKEVR